MKVRSKDCIKNKTISIIRALLEGDAENQYSKHERPIACSLRIG